MTLSAERDYQLNITGTSSDGRGIGRINGMAVFADGAVEGDVAAVKIKRVKKSFAEGIVTKIIIPSPRRIEPECRYFSSCGGCQTANIDYAFELEKKAESITQAMRRIGGFSDFELGGIESGSRMRYRNKAVYKLSEGVCGFYSAKSHNVTGVEDCLLCDKRDSKIISALSAYLENNEASRDIIHELFIRRGRKTGQVMAAVNASARPGNIKELAEYLTGAEENIVSVILNVKNKPAEVLFGREYIEDELLGVRFRISNRSFYQVNPEMTERLYSQVLEYAALTGRERVLDIYCGIGTISLCAAGRAAEVTGVEIVSEAVENARENAHINNIGNAVFHAAGAEKIVPRLIGNGERPDVVILDPPRKGSDRATLAAVLAAGPERVIYVSCNPSTLARDARILADGGYKICASRAFDMFPCTAHVETVCLLSKLHSDQHIEVELQMDEFDLTAAESKATYEEIKEYVLEHTGLKVSSLYIAQVKQKCGIIERINYNPPKSESSRQPKCPPEKEKAIRDALEYFRMI